MAKDVGVGIQEIFRILIFNEEKDSFNYYYRSIALLNNNNNGSDNRLFNLERNLRRVKDIWHDICQVYQRTLQKK